MLTSHQKLHTSSVFSTSSIRRIEVRPVDIINGLYLLTNLMLIALYYERLPHWRVVATGYSFCLIVQLLLMAVIPNERYPNLIKTHTILRDWYPYLLTGFYYPALGDMLGVLFNQHFDSILIKADQIIFGTDISLHFVKWFPNLFIYELMHFFYFFYYFFAFSTGYFLYRLVDKEIFKRFMFVLILMISVQFYFFILWPTAGPKFGFPELAGLHLPARGIFSYIMHSMLTNGEIPGGAFPSSHVSVSLMCCLFVTRYLNRNYSWLWIMFIGLFISTVYLQQHYAVDSIGGVAIALLFYNIGNHVYDQFQLTKNIN